MGLVTVLTVYIPYYLAVKSYSDYTRPSPVQEFLFCGETIGILFLLTGLIWLLSIYLLIGLVLIAIVSQPAFHRLEPTTKIAQFNRIFEDLVSLIEEIPTSSNGNSDPLEDPLEQLQRIRGWVGRHEHLIEPKKWLRPCPGGYSIHVRKLIRLIRKRWPVVQHLLISLSSQEKNADQTEKSKNFRTENFWREFQYTSSIQDEILPQLIVIGPVGGNSGFDWDYFSHLDLDQLVDEESPIHMALQTYFEQKMNAVERPIFREFYQVYGPISKVRYLAGLALWIEKKKGQNAGNSNFGLWVRDYIEVLEAGVRDVPDGYWINWDDFSSEMRDVITLLGQIPSHTELGRIGLSSSRLGFRKFGGKKGVNERFGLEFEEPIDWSDRETFFSELGKIIDEIGHFPSENDLVRLGKSTAKKYFLKFGGTDALREYFGFSPTRRPTGYWEVRENLIREIRPVYERLGHFPTQKELNAAGLSSTILGFAKFPREEILAEFGHIPPLPKAYWDDWDNLKRELLEIMENTGEFPKRDELSDLGISYTSIYQTHGGYEKVKERLAEETSIDYIPANYYKDWDNLIEALTPLVNQLRRFPTQQEINEALSGNIQKGIDFFGRDVVRKYFDPEDDWKKPGFWKNISWEDFRKECERVIKIHGDLPSQEEMVQFGLSPSAFTKWGGIMDVRHRLGLEQKIKPPGYWKNFSNIESEIADIVEKIHHFPSKTELEELGHNSLSNKIVLYHGGLDFVRKRLGYEPRTTYTQVTPDIKKRVIEVIQETPLKNSSDCMAQLAREDIRIHYRTFLRIAREIYPTRELLRSRFPRGSYSDCGKLTHTILEASLKRIVDECFGTKTMPFRSFREVKFANESFLKKGLKKDAFIDVVIPNIDNFLSRLDTSDLLNIPGTDWSTKFLAFKLVMIDFTSDLTYTNVEAKKAKYLVQ